MKILYQRDRVIVFIMSVALLSSCASARVTSQWKDETYRKKPGKIAVLALLPDAARRITEDEVTEQLKSSGTDAVAAYTILPEGKANKEVIEEKVRHFGADALFLIRLIDKRTEREYVPGAPYTPPFAYRDWYAYYGGFYPPAPVFGPGYAATGYPPGYPSASPGYVVEKVYDIAEANLYDTSTGKLAWSAVTESRIQGDDRKAIKSWVTQVMKALEKDHILR